MLCETGRVVAIEGEWVWVETQQMSACHTCSAKSACGQNLLNNIFPTKRQHLKISTNNCLETIRLHDNVELALPEQSIVKGALWLYGLPLVLLLLGMSVAASLFPASDAAAASGALIGFLIAVLLVKWHSYRYRFNPVYQPVIKRVLPATIIGMA